MALSPSRGREYLGFDSSVSKNLVTRDRIPASPQSAQKRLKGLFCFAVATRRWDSKDGGGLRCRFLKWHCRRGGVRCGLLGTHSDGSHTARPFEVFSEKSKRCTAPVGRRTLWFLVRLCAKKLSDS